LPNHAVTFETNVWEGDWAFVLNTGRLKKVIDSCRYPFAERILYINNVNDRAKVAKAAEKYLKNGILTSARFVEDLEAEALKKAGLEKGSFKGGYYYFIQNLVGVYNCATDYLLHMTGDSIITGDESWIDESITRMENDRSILVANPNGDPEDVMNNLVEEEPDFYRGFGFSDQCYLIRTGDFKKPVYTDTHPASERFPVYAADSFEKRLDSYMHNHSLYRLTSKGVKYRHQNFPKDPVRKALLFLTGINLKKGR
jgi:hypothetical protein